MFCFFPIHLLTALLAVEGKLRGEHPSYQWSTNRLLQASIMERVSVRGRSRGGAGGTVIRLDGNEMMDFLVTTAPTLSPAGTSGTIEMPISAMPTFTLSPSVLPKLEPTVEPTIEPTFEPTPEPSSDPTSTSSLGPSSSPTTLEPTLGPTSEPTPTFSSEPTTPSSDPTGVPSSAPSSKPSAEPSSKPSSKPSAEPTPSPTPLPPPTPTSSPTPPPRICPSPISPAYQGFDDPKIRPCRANSDCLGFVTLEGGPVCCLHPFCICGVASTGGTAASVACLRP